MSTGAPVVHVGGPTEEALFAFRAGRLLPEAAGWIGDHVDGCQRCRRAMDRIEALHEALEPPAERPFVRQADITAVRRRLERRRPAWSKIGFAACACAVAGFALMMTVKQRQRAGHEVLAAATSGGENVGFAIAARQGVADVELGDDHAVAEAKMGVPTRGWLTVAPKGRVVATWGGARVAVEGGAAGARVQLSTSLTKLRQLTLERGTVVLDVDPLAAGAELIVATNDARVSVHGTRFFVDSSAAGTQVACDRGRVRVAIAGRVIEVPAGTQLAAGATAPSVLTAESGLRLSALDMTLASGPTESLDVFADVADATVAVDGVDYGRAPLSLAVAPGNHAVRVSAAGRLPVEERVAVGAGSPTLFRAELLELSIDEPAANDHAERAAPPPNEAPRADANQAARDALGRARAEVLAGAYDRAISRLQSLRAGKAPRVQLDRAALLQAQAERLAHRPERALPLLIGVTRSDGPEAEQAQFLLAQTFGHDMGDPLRAAVAYAESERRFAHGIFAEEAAFRHGESLLSGGDTRAGLEALEDYLRRFPSAPHADDAHLFVAGARRDRLGDCAGAVPHLQAVAAGHGPRAPQALIGAARCLHTLGRQAEADSAYERYLQTQPHGRYADEARLGATGSARLTK